MYVYIYIYYLYTEDQEYDLGPKQGFVTLL